MKSLPEPAREPNPEPPPQLGDGFSPPPGEADVQGGRSLADPAEPPHPAPLGQKRFLKVRAVSTHPVEPEEPVEPGSNPGTPNPSRLPVEPEFGPVEPPPEPGEPAGKPPKP